MNKQIFKDPVGLMENISGVTSWLKKKILENGGDAERETLNIVNDRAGAPYFVDKEGEYWRAYLFIIRTISENTGVPTIILTTCMHWIR